MSFGIMIRYRYKFKIPLSYVIYFNLYLVIVDNIIELYKLLSNSIWTKIQYLFIYLKCKGKQAKERINQVCRMSFIFNDSCLQICLVYHTDFLRLIFYDMLYMQIKEILNYFMALATFSKKTIDLPSIKCDLRSIILILFF